MLCPYKNGQQAKRDFIAQKTRNGAELSLRSE